MVNGNALNEMSVEEQLQIMRAMSKIYPMIVLANLTKNTYTMLRDESFLYERLAGDTYDEMIENGVKHIHESYKQVFLDCFDRQKLIQRFENGEHAISAKLYQRDVDGNYHWVTTRAIRVEDESGDIIHICLNEVIPLADMSGHPARYGTRNEQ